MVGPSWTGQDATGGGDVVGQRGERILDDADLVALGGQAMVDPAPARAVGEGAVDQDDVADIGRLGLGGAGQASEGGGGDEDVAERAGHWGVSF